MKYINLPEERMLLENLPPSLEVTLSGSGYKLLSFLLNPAQTFMLIDGRNLGNSPKSSPGDAFLVTHHSIDFFNRQYNDIKALHAQPDTIYFNFVSKGYKRVPVKLNAWLDFEKQYNISDSIRISPDTIHISGPRELLDSIEFAETEALVLKGLNKPGTYNVQLKRLNPELSMAPMEVAVQLSVEQFTEAVIDVPITIEHLMRKDSVEIFPSQAKIVFMVALSKYNKVNVEQFQVVADIFDLKVSPSGKLKLYLRKFPSFIQNIRMEPEYVDFIIRAK